MRIFFILTTFIFSLASCACLKAQSAADTSEQVAASVVVKKGSIFNGEPGKSMLLSLIIPGSGQYYNGSILRAHFAWAAVGTIGYIMVNNTRQYRCFRDAYISKIDGNAIHLPDYADPYIPFTKITEDDLNGITDPNIIRKFRDEANKNKQLSIVIFSFAWLLNGVDAFVDAHLKDFDINEDLSFKFDSRFDNDPNAPMRLGLYVQF